MKKVILKIDGMSCSACSSRIEKYLNKHDGVNASVNLIMGQSLINYDENKVSINDLERFIEECGYKSLGIYNDKIENKKNNDKLFLIIFGILLIIFIVISMIDFNYSNYYFTFIIIVTISFLIYGFDILKSGINKIIHLNPNMDTLVTIGVLSSFIYSTYNLIQVMLGNSEFMHNLYFESTIMIIYFIKLGRFIDNNAKEKTKESIKGLVQITPKSAFIKKEGNIEEITIDEVKKGDTLICKPGMKVAVDGVITSGSTHVNESFITGESKSSKKVIGNNVVAGSICMDGYIEYKAEKIGPESTISQIVRLVSEAINSKMPIQRITDVISRYFVIFIMVVAFITFCLNMTFGHNFNESIISFVTVLVVSCPCALGLATPLAMVVSVGKSAKNGILIKKSEILEITKNVDTIVFDKTGTLTYGHLSISKILNYSDYSDAELLEIVGSLESKSNHPISVAFNKYFNSKIDINDFNEIAGVGIEGRVLKDKIYVGSDKLLKLLHLNDKYKEDELKISSSGESVIYVIKNKKVIALIGVKDVIRNNSKEVIKNLKKLNKSIIMLSGDNEITALSIAKEIGIDTVVAGVLPHEKEKYIRNLKENGHVVMMVGDGINDALSLSISDVGLSISSGTDIACDSSDVIIMKNDLSKIISLFELSKKTVKVIKQNLFWAFIYNIIMILIATGLFKSCGIYINPVIASISMTLSSLIVTFNSLRLRK